MPTPQTSSRIRRLGLTLGLTLGLVPALLLGLAPAAATADVLGLPLPGGGQQAAPSAAASAPDSRLRPGCRDYRLRYDVSDSDGDWLLDLVVRDRTGQDVARVSLHGAESRPRGTSTFSVCRAAVAAGRFTVSGVLLDRDGWEQTEHPVEGSGFWLTRR